MRLVGMLAPRAALGAILSGDGLVRAMLADGLVDHLHLFLYPIAVGSGQRLWADGVDATRLRLSDSDVYANGVVHLDYGRA